MSNITMPTNHRTLEHHLSFQRPLLEITLHQRLNTSYLN